MKLNLTPQAEEIHAHLIGLIVDLMNKDRQDGQIAVTKETVFNFPDSYRQMWDTLNSALSQYQTLEDFGDKVAGIYADASWAILRELNAYRIKHDPETLVPRTREDIEAAKNVMRTHYLNKISDEIGESVHDFYGVASDPKATEFFNYLLQESRLAIAEASEVYGQSIANEFLVIEAELEHEFEVTKAEVIK